MKIVNTNLLNLQGETIMSGDTEMTVAVALINCALSPTADGKPRLKTDVASRYDLAIRLNALKIGESIDIPVDMAAKLTDDLLRIYTTIISGQMLPILDGASTH